MITPKSAWKNLEKDLTEWLASFTNQDLVYRNPNQAIIGFPLDGFRSDGLLTDGETLLAIEVEAGQMHPDTNVGKYWLLHLEHKAYQRIVLVHIYTPAFDSYGWRKRLAEFYASRMKEEMPIEYMLLDYRDSTDYKVVLSEVKEIIVKKIVELF